MISFYRPNDRSPLSASEAVQRGQAIVNLPVLVLIVLGFSVAAFVALFSILLAVIPAVVGYIGGWLWWSYSVPQWRRWALQRVANAEELQKLGVATKLVWPKGSIFEKTEFRGKVC